MSGVSTGTRIKKKKPLVSWPALCSLLSSVVEMQLPLPSSPVKVPASLSVHPASEEL